jgi:hypothetical protein
VILLSYTLVKDTTCKPLMNSILNLGFAVSTV